VVFVLLSRVAIPVVMRVARVLHERFVCDACVLVLVALVSLTAAARLGVTGTFFQEMFVIVCGAAAARRLIAHRLVAQRLVAQRSRKTVLTLAAAVPSLAWMSLAHNGPESFTKQTVLLPLSMRWLGVGVGIVSIAAPFLKRASRESWHGDESKAILSLCLLAANGAAAVLAFVAIPMTILLRPKELPSR
jgi:hypothetical protein